MVMERSFCVNHPDRLAIGVCVITRKPICGECSTRYEGVNYSKEGLAILQKRRQAAAPATHRRRMLFYVSLILLPLMFCLMYWSIYSSIEILMNVLHRRI